MADQPPQLAAQAPGQSTRARCHSGIALAAVFERATFDGMDDDVSGQHIQGTAQCEHFSQADAMA